MAIFSVHTQFNYTHGQSITTGGPHLFCIKRWLSNFTFQINDLLIAFLKIKRKTSRRDIFFTAKTTQLSTRGQTIWRGAYRTFVNIKFRRLDYFGTERKANLLTLIKNSKALILKFIFFKRFEL